MLRGMVNEAFGPSSSPRHRHHHPARHRRHHPAPVLGHGLMDGAPVIGAIIQPVRVLQPSSLEAGRGQQ
eukprot:9851995-Alexandrium_andersonii.AAC.1